MIKKVVLLILILIVVILSFVVFEKTSRHEDVYFTISSGETADLIIDNLKEQKIITNEQKAINYVYENDFTFYPNTYLLQTNMELEELFSILSNPTSNIENMETLTIVEGEQLTQIAEDISKLSFIDMSSDEIINYWSDLNNLNTWIGQYDFLTDDILTDSVMFPLEGYILPATYPMNVDYTIDSLTTMLLDNTQDVITGSDITTENIHDVLTLASIVERETLLEEDKPNVASVFINRINTDMPLQSDITVLYAMQEQKSQVLYSDLEYDSPYNTYLYSGLPPGPIASPSVSSINAVVNAPSTNYYYFFAVQDTGEIKFSETYEEHQAISEEYAWDYE